MSILIHCGASFDRHDDFLFSESEFLGSRITLQIFQHLIFFCLFHFWHTILLLVFCTSGCFQQEFGFFVHQKKLSSHVLCIYIPSGRKHMQQRKHVKSRFTHKNHGTCSRYFLAAVAITILSTRRIIPFELFPPSYSLPISKCESKRLRL